MDKSLQKTQRRLKQLKKEIDQELNGFFEHEIRKAQKLDQAYAEAVQMVADFTLRGGKRIRPILMVFGYLAAGGKKNKAIIRASLALELAHSFLLIHDDIIDNDESRRGHLTLHREYEKIFKDLKVKKSQSMSQSMAMLCGNIAYTLANQILCQSKFEPKLKIAALEQFQATINETIAGEMMDFIGSLRRTLNLDDITKIYHLKTAKYTIEGPLLLGAILGGANTKVKKSLSQYATLLGVSFQIQDDLLGIFGSPKETGKPVGSDLREGKETIILFKTLEKSSPEQKKIISRMLGNNCLGRKEINQFKKIAEATDARRHCSALANNLSLKAKEALLASTIPASSRDFLLVLADFMIERKN